MVHHTHNLEDLHGRSRHAAAAAPPRSPTAPPDGTRPERQRGYVGITDHLGVTPKTVRKLTATRELAPYRLGTKMLRIKLADFDAACKPVPGGAV